MPGASSLRRDVNSGVMAQAGVPNATEIGRGVVNSQPTPTLLTTRTRSVAVRSQINRAASTRTRSVAVNESYYASRISTVHATWISVLSDSRTEQYLVADSSIARNAWSFSMPLPPIRKLSVMYLYRGGPH